MNSPPAVMIHSSPANAWFLLEEIERLARDYPVFAPDSPGFGLSQPLPLAEMQVAKKSLIQIAAKLANAPEISDEMLPGPVACGPLSRVSPGPRQGRAGFPVGRRGWCAWAFRVVPS